MSFRVGDHVYNRATNEQGTIIRLTQLKGHAAFVVKLPRNEVWPEREVLWRKSEVSRLRHPNARSGPS